MNFWDGKLKFYTYFYQTHSKYQTKNHSHIYLKTDLVPFVAKKNETYNSMILTNGGAHLRWFSTTNFRYLVYTNSTYHIYPLFKRAIHAEGVNRELK